MVGEKGRVHASTPKSAIVWASTPFNGNANNAVVEGVLHAFDAETMQELWTDKQNQTRDEVTALRAGPAAVTPHEPRSP